MTGTADAARAAGAGGPAEAVRAAEAVDSAEAAADSAASFDSAAVCGMPDTPEITGSAAGAARLASRTDRRILHGMVWGTLLLKLLWLFYCGARYDYASDDRGYLESARILAATGVLTYNDPTQPTLFITPGLPVVLALLGRIIGTWEPQALAQAFRLLQALLGAASLFILYRIGKRFFAERTVIWGVAAAACYPPFWLESAFVFTEGLFTLLLLLLLDRMLRTLENPTLGSGACLGMLWALTVYVRPTIALWPAVVFLLLLYARRWPLRTLLRPSASAGLLFLLLLLPWWVRNADVSGGRFIPLTQSGGNPLLLGTYPFTVPALFLEEQRTWHPTNDLRVNDKLDTQRALERLRDGFLHRPFLYTAWYTIGKFALFWGDVFYWMPIPGIPLAAAVLAHYAILIPGFAGILTLLRRRSELPAMPAYDRGPNRNPLPPDRLALCVLVSMPAYLTLLHMIYLAHSRYSVPLLPLLALFATWRGREWRMPGAQRYPTTTGD